MSEKDAEESQREARLGLNALQSSITRNGLMVARGLVCYFFLETRKMGGGVHYANGIVCLEDMIPQEGNARLPPRYLFTALAPDHSIELTPRAGSFLELESWTLELKRGGYVGWSAGE